MDSAFSIHSFSSYFGLKLETRNPTLGQKLFCWIFMWLLQCFQKSRHPVKYKSFSNCLFKTITSEEQDAQRNAVCVFCQCTQNSGFHLRLVSSGKFIFHHNYEFHQSQRISSAWYEGWVCVLWVFCIFFLGYMVNTLWYVEKLNVLSSPSKHNREWVPSLCPQVTKVQEQELQWHWH